MACSSLHRLSEIDDTTDLWKVKVRISRKWNVVDFETGKQILRVEMVLLDENDHQVQATIPKRLITKYSVVIREGGVYFLQNLSVSPAKGVYRPVQHRYKVFFKWDTNVKPVSDIRLTFPKFKFDFVEYNNIKFRHGDNTYLTDVYGKLESVSNVMNVERGTLREIFLKDKSGTTLKVTLWGQANQQLPDDVVTASAGCPILVVTSSTVKLFDGNYSLSSTTATKIYVNLDIPEVADLKETNSNEETTVKLIAPSSTAITLEERMVSNRKTLVEIVQAVPNAAIGAKFTCKGVISEVIYDYEPFYFSCNNKECRKKVVHRGSKHWCDNCKNFVDYPVAKYKIHVEIRDRTQSVSISIFDREVERLLKLPVTEMIDLNTMDNGSESVKDILKKLVGLEFVFEIKISEFNIRNEDGDASFTASKVWVVNEEIEARHFTESIEGDRKMKRVVEDSTTYASSSESNNDSLHVTTYASSNQSNNASLQERKKQKMVDNKKIELASGGVTSYVSDRTKEKEIGPSPIELNSEDMDDAPVSSIIAKGKRGRRKLLSE